MIRIVIPIYQKDDNLTVLKLCLNSIFENTPKELYDLYLVDNGSDNKVLTEYLKSLTNCKIIISDKNLGYSGGCNLALNDIKDEDILLLNSDTIVYGNWLQNMHRTLYSNVMFGMIGPYTNDGGKAQTLRNVPFYSKADDIKKYVENLEKNNKHKIKYFVYEDMSIGFCVLIKNETFKKVGYWDEQFWLFDDVDYYFRALVQNYNTVIAEDSFVFHNRNYSFKNFLNKEIAYKELFTKSENMLKEKWFKLGYDDIDFCKISRRLNNITKIKSINDILKLSIQSPDNVNRDEIKKTISNVPPSLLSKIRQSQPKLFNP